jgi:ABC-2 type transport system ATP-binding protein
MKFGVHISDYQLNSIDDSSVVLTADLRKFYATVFWLNQKLISLKSCFLQLCKGETFGYGV